jgi:hypothetical protein
MKIDLERSTEVFLVTGYHSVNVASLSLEESNFGFEVFDFLRKELYQVFEVLTLLFQFVLLRHVVVLEQLLVSRVQLLLQLRLLIAQLCYLCYHSCVLPFGLQKFPLPFLQFLLYMLNLN